jgi:hypothetical protein
MAKIRSEGTKRAYLAALLFVGLLFAGAGYLGYMMTRDPGASWDQPNAVEAELASKQIAFYLKSKAEGNRGWVKITEVGLNSYLHTLVTNPPPDVYIPPTRFPVELERMGVALHKPDLTVYSWGVAKVVTLDIPFVVQRRFEIEHDDTKGWTMPLASLRIGEVEIPRWLWGKTIPTVNALDAPVMARLGWTTNISEVLVARNELSQRSELHLYTYAPIPQKDRR